MLSSSIKYLVFLLWVGAVYFIGIGIFTSGFLLRRQGKSIIIFLWDDIFGTKLHYHLDRFSPIGLNVEMVKGATSLLRFFKRLLFS